MSTVGLQTFIVNGWFSEINKPVNECIEEIKKAIKNKKSETITFDIFNALEVKNYIESICSDFEVCIINNLVCAPVYIKINIDYNKLSDGDYYAIVSSL
ncbi:MAG: hypothetical protein WC554_05970 [Clostridia bacterium]